MEREAMHSFLSEESVSRHKAYLKQLVLEYSVLLASEPRLEDKCASEIAFMRIKSDIRNEAYAKRREIELHELYFSSFIEDSKRCENLPEGFRSVAELRYEIYRVASERREADFLVVAGDKKSRRVRVCADKNIGPRERAILALDLCEHAYFSDYGYDRDRYLKNAISRLNLSLVSDFVLDAGNQKKRD